MRLFASGGGRLVAVTDGRCMMNERRYTLPELAREAGISESTARRYCKEFFNFLPGQKSGRIKTFKPECIQVLQRIKQLYDEGQETDQVREVLTQEFSQVVDLDRQSHPDDSQQREPSARELMKELVAELRGSSQQALPDPSNPGHILERLDRIEQRLDHLEKNRQGWFKRMLSRKK